MSVIPMSTRRCGHGIAHTDSNAVEAGTLGVSLCVTGSTWRILVNGDGTVEARNLDGSAAEVTVTGAYGSKQVALAPGAATSATFATRLSTLPAGSVSVQGVDPADPARTGTTTTAFAPATC